jgi:predicted outer membrane repeat protein
VFDVELGVTATITGLTIADGNYSAGGGIVNAGTLTVSNCTVSGNSATDIGGGAIFNQELATLAVINSTVSGNSAS